MFTISLIEPQIPPNTGNIARLCASVNCRLELVGKLGFDLDNSKLKRAGLDYWDQVNWEYYPDLDRYLTNLDGRKLHLLTTKSSQSYTEHNFKSDDYLLFGSETTGIDPKYREMFAEQCCTIPMSNPAIRSLNLSSSVAIVLFEALRQQTRTIV